MAEDSLPLPAWRPAQDLRPFLYGLGLLLVVGLFTTLPTLVLVLGSFDVAPQGERFRWGWDNWQSVLSDPAIRRAMGYTFLLSLRAPIGVALAFIIAWLLVRIEIPGRRLIEYGLWFAFFLPTLPLAVGWILLLDPNYGLVNELLQRIGLADHAIFSIYSVLGIMWVHLSLTVIPINVILLAPAIRQMDIAFEEAASIAGAHRLRILMRITLPLLAPACLTALIVGFVKSLEAFEVEQILGVPAKIRVFATTIYDYVHWDPPRLGEAMALSSLFLLLLLLVALLYRFILGTREGHATITGKTTRIRAATRPRWGWLASAILLAYMAVALLLPLAVLLLGTFTRLFGFFFMANAWTARHWLSVLGDPDFRQAFANSFLVAGCTACLGTLLYALLAWCIARSSLWGRQILNLLIWLPWAIPGILLGFSMLTLLLNVPGLSLIHGTVLSLILVLLIKEVPLGVQMLKTAIFQIAREIEEAGRTSGASFPAIFRRILLPLIAPMFGSVFLLTFVAAFRDISATILLAGPSSRTMAILMIELGEEGRFEAMAVVGVILSLVVLAMTAAMRRLQARVSLLA
jgi:iron(III) transport system permease protein